MAMVALKFGTPEDYMQLLQVHADAVNLLQFRVDENVAFSSVQANIAPAVTQNESFTYPFLCLFIISLNILLSLYK